MGVMLTYLDKVGQEAVELLATRRKLKDGRHYVYVF